MKRDNGFLVLDDIFNIDSTKSFIELYNSLSDNSNVYIVKHCYSPYEQLVFYFIYNKEKYYFKYDSFASCYNELIAEEIASDLNIPHLHYELAKIGQFQGVISKDYKKQGVKYISGYEFLRKYYGKYPDETLVNNLHIIWFKLEDYYKDRDNMQEIVSNLMKKLVDIFLFDILTGQLDRNCDNWEIVEYPDGTVDLNILFDNTRMIIDPPASIRLALTVEPANNLLDTNINSFQRLSSSEFSHLLPDRLWVINRENIEKIFEIIAAKTGAPIPKDIKKKMFYSFQLQLDFIMKTLNITEISIPNKNIGLK